jgi:hypothetical protein
MVTPRSAAVVSKASNPSSGVTAIQPSAADATVKFRKRSVSSGVIG